jgi:hypothetical protein
VIRDIPTDDKIYSKLAQQVSLRMQASNDYYVGHREDWQVAWNRWNKYPDRPQDVADDDPYEIKIGYGFGLIEQLNAKVTEPMLQMGVPFGVFPKQFGDQKACDNFVDIVRDFYSKPNVQESKRGSKKGMIVCGPRWEIYEWLHVEENGKMWGEIEKLVEQAVVNPETGKPQTDKDGKPVMARMMQKVIGEIVTKIVTYYGFNIRCPRVEDVYPEPNRTTIDTGQNTDLSWLVEDMGELALEDMAREVIYNPDTKKTERRYNFDRLLKEAGPKAEERYKNIIEGKGTVDDNYGQLIVPVSDWTDASASGQLKSNKGQDANSSFEDRDKVRIYRMRTKNELRLIANGKHIIERITDPWHRPRMNCAIENYTQDPRCIYGPGAIKPILDELIELDITHSLGMQNLFRVINRMIAVKQKAIVSMDELDRRAGGVVRINDEVDQISQAIQAFDQQSSLNDMLGAESAIKGSLEFTSSNLDGSPGTRGTKQDHKTKGGLEIISENMGTRFVTMQAQALITEARAGIAMSYLLDQFFFEPTDYRSVQENGTTLYKRFSREDIDTKGRGFNFTVTVDPLWGNTRAQRQDAQDLFELGIKYEELRLQIKDPKMKQMQLSELMEDLLKKHGRRDLSDIFIKPTGEIDPGQELQILAQGGVVQCKGDLQEHITAHLLQVQSPGLQKMIEAGKADPKTKQNLMLLIEEDTKRLVTFLKDPQGAASQKLNSAGMSHPGMVEQ